MTFKLRPYQEEARDHILGDWGGGDVNVLLALPTGLGKTEVGIAVLQDQLVPGKRALWLAHRDHLIQQPLERLRRRWPNDTTRIGVVKAEQDEVAADLIFGSVQTVTRDNRLAKLMTAGPIDYLVTDEAHHAPAESYRYIYDRLREQNPNLLHLGMTATPKRTDGIGLDCVFGKISYEMNIQKAIKEGWLVPAKGVQIETGVSIAGVDISRGDFVAGQLADVLDANQWHEKVVDAFFEHASDRQCLAYTPNVMTSKRLCAEFLSRGIAAAHVDANTPRDERRATLKQFREDEIQVVCNCLILHEGFDAPSADCILMARPTQSHPFFTQIVGRGLRIYPEKKNCLVLLFATTGARILTLYDLGGSKALDKAEEAAAELGVEGVSSQIPLFDEGKIEGVGLYAKAVNLFAADDAAWFRDGDIFSIGLGCADGWQRMMVILPPNGVEEWALYRIVRKAKLVGKKWGREQWEGSGRWQVMEPIYGDIDELLELAGQKIAEYAVPVLTKRKNRKDWEGDPATAGQRKWVSRWLPPDVVTGLTKGAAAKVITHHVAMDVLRREGYG